LSGDILNNTTGGMQNLGGYGSYAVGTQFQGANAGT